MSDPSGTDSDEPPENDRLSPVSAESDSAATSAPADADGPAQKRPRRRMVIAAAAASAVVLLAAVALTFVLWDRTSAPEQAVESFLEASQEMDIEAALDHVVEDDQLGQLVIDGEPRGVAMFDADSPRSDWDIEEIELLNRSYRDSDTESAEVEATITAPDGTSVHDTFELIDEGDDDWKLQDPYTEFEIPSFWNNHIEVNGQHFETDPSIEFPTVYFLPGVYEFYDRGLDFIEPSYDSVIKLGDSTATIGLDGNPDFTFGFTSGQYEHEELEELYELSDGSDAEAELQPHLESFIDECIDEQPETTVHECPKLLGDVALGDGLDQHEGDELSVDRQAAKWSVSAYPTMSATYTVGDSTILEFTTAEMGTIDVTVPEAESPDTTYSFQCSLDVGSIAVGFTSDGEIDLGPITELPAITSFYLLEDGLVDCSAED